MVTQQYYWRTPYSFKASCMSIIIIFVKSNQIVSSDLYHLIPCLRQNNSFIFFILQNIKILKNQHNQFIAVIFKKLMGCIDILDSSYVLIHYLLHSVSSRWALLMYPFSMGMRSVEPRSA